MILLYHVGAHLPLSYRYLILHHEPPGYEHLATLRPDRARAMSSKRRMSSQRYIPHCSATRSEAGAKQIGCTTMPGGDSSADRRPVNQGPTTGRENRR
jgi:hypothetical protein